jgi:hypothetical protein
MRILTIVSKIYSLTLVSCATGTAVWRNGGCSASYDSFVVDSSSVLRLNFCAKNPPLRQAAKRYRKPQNKSHYEINLVVR